MNSLLISGSRDFEKLSTNMEEVIEKNIMVFENVDWTNIIFEKILRKGLQNNNIQDVVMVNKRLACKRGQNFMSQLWRFSLRYTCYNDTARNDSEKIVKDVHLILKEEPLPGFSLDYIRENNIFSIELMVFESILPTLERLLGKQLAPRFFYGSTRPPTIIMEDLTPLGFKTRSRQEGLPKAHTLKAIESIAQFHAASVALNEMQPNYLPQFTRAIVSEKSHENMYKFLDFIIHQISQKIQDWPESWALRASEKLTKLLTFQRQRILTVNQYDSDEFCVLNHGDCWVTNFMFKENDDGIPIDVRMLDFQLTVWTSPAIDLLYFLSICPEVSLKVDYDDFFLDVYLKVLTRTMTKLGCKTKPPTIQQLKASMYKRRIYAIMSGLIFYPRMIAEDSDVEDLEDSLTEGTTKMDIFKNPRAVKALKKMIPSMLEKGYLD